MTEDNSRGLSIVDLMTVVAALAIALVGIRATERVLTPFSAELKVIPFWLTDRLDWAAFLLGLALIPIRLRRPRPGRDVLWRRPGWLACVGAATMAVLYTVRLSLFYLLEVAAGKASPGEDLWRVFFGALTQNVPDEVSNGVALVWVITALSGRWEAEGHWIDRAGRVVGWYWVISGFAVSPFGPLAYY